MAAEVTLTGVIPRTTDISNALEILELTGDIDFVKEDGKIICRLKKKA